MLLVSRYAVFAVSFILAVRGGLATASGMHVELVISTLLIISLLALDDFFDNRRFVAVLPIACLCLAGCFETTFNYVPILVFEVTTIATMSQPYNNGLNKRIIYVAGSVALGVAMLTAHRFAGIEMLGLIAGISMLGGMLSYFTCDSIMLKKLLQHDRDMAVETTNELKDKSDYEISLATLKERNRIAREIHDNVGHELTRTILLTGAITAMNKDENLKEHLNVLKGSLDNAMNNIRSSVHDLHDESIDVEISIKENVRELESRFNLRLNYDMSKDINKDIKYAIIAIAKECSTNTLKYSNGENVYISMIEHPAFYRISFEDDGKLDNKASDGIGLKNISDRVLALGGNININTDKGFRVYYTIPKNGR